VAVGEAPSRNVEVVRDWVACYNARDLEGLMGFSDPSIEFKSVFAGMGSDGVFRGYDGVREYFAEIDGAYESFQVLVSEYIDAGAGVLTIAEAVWRGRGSGADGSTPIFPAFWLKAGKVLLEETFRDRAEGFAALGLSPENA
jgi:ketosteroid isomerase-like protein